MLPTRARARRAPPWESHPPHGPPPATRRAPAPRRRSTQSRPRRTPPARRPPRQVKLRPRAPLPTPAPRPPRPPPCRTSWLLLPRRWNDVGATTTTLRTGTQGPRPPLPAPHPQHGPYLPLATRAGSPHDRRGAPRRG